MTNLSSPYVSVNNFEKLHLLQAFNSVYKYDIICIGETFLNFSYSNDDPSLYLSGYNMIRSDHPNNIKRGGVCIYFKDTLPLKILNISQLNECLVVEIAYEDKKCMIVSLYCSPSQTSEDFDSFLTNFENLIDTIFCNDPFLVLILGDFNAKLSSWSSNDIDTLEGISINDLTTSYGLTQLISDPTHILPNSSSCIDLIFCNQTNIVTNCGVLPSLHPNCHHQITFANLNFNVCIPPPYERLIWHYNKSDIESIKKALDLVNWDFLFQNVGVNEQVDIFNITLLNIFKNYTPNENIIIDEIDPPWIKKSIKYKISQRHKLYDYFVNNGKRDTDYQKILEATENLNHSISNSKSEYYNRLSSKLVDNKTSSKAYWT